MRSIRIKSALTALAVILTVLPVPGLRGTLPVLLSFKTYRRGGVFSALALLHRKRSIGW